MPISCSRRSFLSATAAALALPLGANGAESYPALQAGIGLADITPAPGVRLDGTIMQIGPVKHVHDRLYTRAIALDDGKERLVITVCDATMIDREVFERAKELVHAKTGLPKNRMLISATHSHSAIRALISRTDKLHVEYLELLARRMAEAIEKSLVDLAPAEVGYGTVDKSEYVFNRRWFLKSQTVPGNPFGKTTDRVKMNPGYAHNNLDRPSGPVDPAFSLLAIRRADGTPVGVLANYSLHYAGGFHHGDVSADYFGVFSRELAKCLDVSNGHFAGILSNGTSGDISCGFDYRKPRPRHAPYEWMEELGRDMADAAGQVCKRIDYRTDVSLGMKETSLELKVRKPDERSLAWAKDLWAKPKDKAGKKRLSWPEIYAREAIYLSQYPPKVSIKLQALRIGSLGIAAVPCEAFAKTGLSIKKASPLKPTFVISLANGYRGYLPPPEQHALGGYETWPARSSFLEADAEPSDSRHVVEIAQSGVNQLS